MSVAARNHHEVTGSDDVRMGVRAPQDAVVRPIRPDLNPGTAYTPAIPRSPQDDQAKRTSKIRNFVSQHAGDAAADLRTSETAATTPRTLTELASTVIPTKGQATNPVIWTAKVVARLFALTVHTVAYLMCAATNTDKRAATALALTLFSLTTALAISLLTGH